MYSIRREENVKPNLDMIIRVVDELNQKFDPTESYHHSASGSEMFEFKFQSDNIRREAWAITFFGHVVVSGSELGLDYSECQEEEYLTLETKNEKKIFMLAVNSTINYISKFINLMALSGASEQNKQKWISMLKKGIEE